MIFLTGQWEWELQRGPQIPPPLTFFNYWRGGGALLTFYLPTNTGGGGLRRGCQLRNYPVDI